MIKRFESDILHFIILALNYNKIQVKDTSKKLRLKKYKYFTII